MEKTINTIIIQVTKLAGKKADNIIFKVTSKGALKSQFSLHSVL